jgi:hypothetical protein
MVDNDLITLGQAAKQAEQWMRGEERDKINKVST